MEPFDFYPEKARELLGGVNEENRKRSLDSVSRVLLRGQ